MRSVIGAMVAIKHAGKIYKATVIDAVAGTNKAKRVRIQQDKEKGGEVLMPSEYTLMEFVS